MSPIFYDLTELYLRSRGKIKYYGIARVVAELAYEVARIDTQVRFVIFDKGRQSFYEVKPLFGKASMNGLVDLGLPDRAVPFRTTEPNARHSIGRRVVAQVSSVAVKWMNRISFPDIGKFMTPVKLGEGVLFSAARPKFIADMADFLSQTGSPVRLSAIIYDMIPLHDEFSMSDWFRQSFIIDNSRILERANQAISISYYTDLELRNAVEQGRLPAPGSYGVVQLAHECRPDGEKADVDLPKRPYFMGVGITMGRKNLDVVLAAILKMIDAGKTPPEFVVAGIDRNRNRKALQQGKYARAEPYVTFISAPNQANLIELYRNALGTVMASRLEGWGLPLGESMWLGTPGISTANSALTEVGGDLAAYFNPDDPAELAAIFDRHMNDKAWHDAQRLRLAAGKAGLRSWHRVATDLLNVVKAENCEAVPLAAQ